MVCARDQPRPGRAGPERVGVRAVQRPHRLAGNLDEGEPNGLPGSYLNGVYELRPLPYAEAGYGYPESGQTVINVTNGKLIRLLVDDEPFDVRYGELRAHERVLDLRAGVLRRRVEWTSPAGRTVRVTSVRSGVARAAGGGRDRLRGRTARRDRPGSSCSPSWSPTSTLPPSGGDPRGAAAARARRCSRRSTPATDAWAVLVHCTRRQRAAGGVRDGPRRRRARRCSVTAKATPTWAGSR